MSRLTVIVLGMALCGSALAGGTGKGGAGYDKPAAAPGQMGERAPIGQDVQNGVVNMNQLANHMVALGRLAQQQGSTQEIRDLGNEIVTQYTQIIGDISTWSAENKVALDVAQLPGRFQTNLQELQGLTGQMFDRQFTQLVSQESDTALEYVNAVLEGPNLADDVKNQFQSFQKVLKQYGDVDTKYATPPRQN